MKRALVSLVVIVVLLAGLATGAFFGLGFYLSPQSRLERSDAIIAISGGDTTARAKEAVQLYQDGWAPRIVFSGAALDPSSPSNARVMSLIAQSKGVPASAIELDEASANTRENAQAVATIVNLRQYKRVILVTSPYHQRRAAIVFGRALGSSVTVLNHSSVDQQWRRSAWWATPYSRQITAAELQKTVYELVAGR